jgi:hypothetical protein
MWITSSACVTHVQHGKPSKVAVFGVGAQPLVAEYKDWLRLLRNGWGAKLREFIQVQFGSVNGSSCIQ